MQEDEFQSVPVRSDEVYASMLQEERIRNTLSQTSPDNQLIEIEWRIRGYKKNSCTNSWEIIDKVSKPVSDLLVSRYISYLSSLLNDNSRFSNYSSLEINKLMCLIIEYLADDLDSNADKYGIYGDYSERTRIAHILLNHTFTVLKRALNGLESQRIWKSMNIGETNQQFQQQKKGIFDSLKFWKRD